MLKFAHKDYEDLTPQQRTQIDECVTEMLKDNTPIDALREAIFLSIASNEVISETKQELTELRGTLERVEELLTRNVGKDPTEE